MIGPTGESRRPFIVGAGEDEAVASKLRWQWIGATALFLVFATVAGALALARVGALG